ncbi:MAG: class I SAM-dependent methyltransferase [Patescibacteria group bacterium]
MLKRVQQKILRKTKENYDIVAADYAGTRDRSWPSGKSILPELKEKLKAQDNILDLGAGSGILVQELAEFGMPLNYTGYDVSEKLVAIAKNKFGSKYSQIQCTWQVGSALKLPFADNTFDHCAAVAVLHHIPSVTLRREVLREIYRVCKPGAFVYITNWYLWTSVAFKKYNLYRQLLRIFEGYDIGDFYIPWRDNKGKIKARRYVHSFWSFEVDLLCRTTGFSVLTPTHLEKAPGQTLAQRIVTIAQKPN